MSREQKSDFSKLISYIENYTIKNNTQNENYSSSLQEIHKCYFSLLQWHAELTFRDVDFLSYINNDKAIYTRLLESISDIGASLFNWINGCYKVTQIMLRVSIENFIRSIGSIENAAEMSEKNVFKVFESASKLSVFSNKNTIQSFNSLHSCYSALCEYIHTNDDKNMELASSLANFPKFSEEKSEPSKKNLLKIIKNFLIVLCICFNEFYHKMHHGSKTIIIDSIPRRHRPSIQSLHI